jgi:hypothetical protein
MPLVDGDEGAERRAGFPAGRPAGVPAIAADPSTPDRQTKRLTEQHWG